MNIIEVQNLVKHFGKTKAVDDISFQVEKGDIFGFLGPNGAGKTTTIRCMMDFIRPTSGAITILGKDAQEDTVEIKKDIGYLSDIIRLNDHWTGQTHINYTKKLNGKKEIADKLMKLFDFDPTKKVKKLSSGNRQKLGLILAFMANPKLIIFDEPTVALDPLLKQAVYTLIEEVRQQGTTVFMSSHNLTEVERLCDRVGIIKQGKMVATESIKSLKEKHLYTVRVLFTKHVEKNELEHENIEITNVLKNGYILRVKSNINPLIQKLGNLPLANIDINEANLEDIFLEFYE